MCFVLHMSCRVLLCPFILPLRYACCGVYLPRVGAGPDKIVLRDGLLVFLQKYVVAHATTLPPPHPTPAYGFITSLASHMFPRVHCCWLPGSLPPLYPHATPCVFRGCVH
jgi:hypothetical protein